MGQFARVIIPPVRNRAAVRPWPERGHLVRLAGETMGTTWAVRFYDISPRLSAEADAAITAALATVVAQMSPWERSSALAIFNAAPAGSWHELPEPFFTVLDAALALARSTDGAFDPTVGALVDTWGFGPAGPRAHIPPRQDVANAAARTGWARIEVNRSVRAIRQPGGVSLDLCGIAKGFAVDHVADALRRLGLRSYLVEIGGELRGEGVKPDGTPWWVAVERPPVEAGETAGTLDTVVALHGMSIATSGDHRRFLEDGGRRYSHTVDPHTGQPVHNALASVSVLHASCMQADALATALTVMGPMHGMTYARDHGLAALFVMRSSDGLRVVASPALARMLE